MTTKRNKQIMINTYGKSLIMMFEQSFPGQFKLACKILDQNEFSKVYDILLNGTSSGAGKLIKQKDNKDKKDEIYLPVTIKRKNVIRQHATFVASKGSDTYALIVIENANLSDLNRLNDYIRNKNILKSTETSCKDLSENLLRLYMKQNINGLEIIRKYGFVHFDLKPQNFLVIYKINFSINEYYPSLPSRKLANLLEDKNKNVQKFTNKTKFLKNFNNLKFPTKIQICKLWLKFELIALCIIISKEILIPILITLSYEKNKEKTIDIFHLLGLIIKLIFNKKVDDCYFKDLIRKINYYIIRSIYSEFIHHNAFRNDYSYDINKILQYVQDDEEKIKRELWKNSLIKKNKSKAIQKFRLKRINKKHKRNLKK